MFFLLPKKRANLVIILPLILAYLLHGAKTPLAFLFLFATTTLIFLSALFTGLLSIRRLLAIAISLLLAWCWLPLLNGAPLATFLFSYTRMLLYVMAFVSAANAFDDGARVYFERTILAIGFIEALLVLSGKLRGLDPQISGHLKNSLHSGILLPAALAFSLSATASAKSHRDRLVHITVSLLLLYAIVLIRSRADLIIVAALGIYIFPRLSIKALGALLLIAAAMFFVNRAPLLGYLEIDSISAIKSSAGRVAIWKTAICAIAHRPLIGFGLGNFEEAYLRFQQPSGELLRYGRTTIFAHNGFLQAATETGIPGLLYLIFIFAAILKAPLRRFAEDKKMHALLIIFFITSLFNYSVALPFNGLIFFMAMGFIEKANKKKNSSSDFPLSQKPLIPAFLSIAALLFSTSFGVSNAYENKKKLTDAARICPLRADAWYALGLECLQKNDVQNALTHLRRALVLNENNAFYWQRLALVLINYFPHDTAAIDTCFDKARNLAPGHAPFSIQEGFYRLNTFDSGKAEELFIKASKLEPDAPLPHLGLALTYARKKDAIEARRHLALCKEIKNNQPQTEKASSYNYEIIHTAYGEMLFNVDPTTVENAEAQIKRL